MLNADRLQEIIEQYYGRKLLDARHAFADPAINMRINQLLIDLQKSEWVDIDTNPLYNELQAYFGDRPDTLVTGGVRVHQPTALPPFFPFPPYYLWHRW